ncbi:hypothetical protein CDIOL_21000 [Clostridium diolis]|uniref:Uncharacterized protein n=1 Tax=Clostridium diolis TaxID=223919 RepID=A0AAV3W1G1_9CLOT|nr:hypothetical protein CDIOL_21000 [Clostridium diolis]
MNVFTWCNHNFCHKKLPLNSLTKYINYYVLNYTIFISYGKVYMHQKEVIKVMLHNTTIDDQILGDDEALIE